MLVVLSASALALAQALTVPAAAEGAVRTDHPAQPVRVTALRFDAMEQRSSYTGTIRPGHEAALGFRLAGKIVARSVEVGDTVRRGQELARLDETDTRLELELAAAELSAARVDLRRAQAEAERSRALFDDGHVAQAALDRATSGAAEAEARADRAARAVVLAENRLGYARLLAEADGVVTSTPGEVGQVVAVGQPVVSVARAGAPDVVFALPEQDRALVEGATARAEIWGQGGTDYALRLRDISPDVDPAGRTYRVRMTIEGADAAAAFGRTVTVVLDNGADAPVAAVPLTAVLDDGSGPVLWRVKGDRVERVAVEVVSITDGRATIRGALSEGDVVVSLGAHKIDPARPVRIVESYPLRPEG